MDILKTATDWVKAEVFSTTFFILFGIGFVAASIGFWQLGKTELAKAYIIPTMVAGSLFLIIGFGLFFTNKSRITQFEKAYNQDASAFVTSEITRVENTFNQYKVVFKIVPLLIIAAALVIIFIITPTWRAIGITTLALLIVILLIDGTAHARIEAYKKQLVFLDKK